MVALVALCLIVILGYLTLYWQPMLQKQSENNIRASTDSHLATVVEALKPFLLQQDLGAIHELLPATVKQNRGWVSIKLLGSDGRRLFPLVVEPLSSEADAQLWTFARPIEFRGEPLGRIELQFDYRPQFELIERRNLEMLAALALALAVALILIIGFIEKTVVRPVQQLSNAANRLSDGDFTASLPDAPVRELSELVSSFDMMRGNLQLHREELLRARDQLERRVETRTAELQQANAMLVAESLERERVESHLRQMQRLESLGKLTGGVAHDFNNLMAVIGGHAELLRDHIGENASLTAIERATNRATTLTQHLLAFSRQQRLMPNAIDLRQLISGLEHLYQRTLGERIRIVASAAPDVWPVMADAGQLDNALLNLSINARDAMPHGGTLAITCNNVHFNQEIARTGDQPLPAGHYVRIDVSDTGEGISPETLARVFEPFFTTKDVGKGSGLGLSMVFGFARQSGGDVQIDSEIGRGTRVSIFLPRAQDPDEALEAGGRAGAAQRGDGLCVLVLEDEDDVRTFIVEVLEGLGYRALEAADAREANQILAEAATVDLILSDVVLPGGISGPEFTRSYCEKHPHVRVVFMTGYAPDLAEPESRETSGHVLLRKPFTRKHLAQALHDSLNA